MQRVVVALALISLVVMVLCASGCRQKIINKPSRTYPEGQYPGTDTQGMGPTYLTGKCAVCDKESTELTEMWAAPFVPGQMMEDRKVVGACSKECKKKFLREGAKGFIKDEKTKDWVPDSANPPAYATPTKK